MRNAANKYGARKTLFGGRLYDSRAEADRAAELELLQKADMIADLEKQPRLHLYADIYYKPDFTYCERTFTIASIPVFAVRIYEDVKGVEGDRFRIIKKLWKLHGPGLLRITKRKDRKSGFVVVEQIPGGAA